MIVQPNLLSRWVGPDPIEILDEGSVFEARRRVRELGREVGLSTTAAEESAISVSELAWNALRHAGSGWVTVGAVDRAGIPGIEFGVADGGPGIADPDQALRGGRGHGLGQGLPAARRLSHELDFDVRYGQGTLVRARRFVSRPPHRWEVALVGRPYPGEGVNGDDGGWVHRGDRLLLALFDGLGHGSGAAEASCRAVERVLETPDEGLEGLMTDLDAALRRTRGAAGALVRCELGARSLAHVCRGNIVTHLFDRQGSRRLPCRPGTLGHDARRGNREVGARIGEGGLLVMHTDGVDPGFQDGMAGELLARHPLVVASRILDGFRAGKDDAMALVVG